MPRDIPVGNGRLLMTFDHRYQIRDVYFPHVGQENHAGNGACRFGLYTSNPSGHGGPPAVRRPAPSPPPASAKKTTPATAPAGSASTPATPAATAGNSPGATTRSG